MIRVLTAVAIWFIFSASASASAQESAGRGSVGFRLISWNVHGIPGFLTRNKSKRLHAIAREIVSRNPDAALLQEVWFQGDARRLRRLLARYGFVPIAKNRFWPFAHAGGLVIFVNERHGWRATSPRFEKFAHLGPVLKVWEGDGAGGKGFLRIDLHQPATGAALTIVNTHLQSPYEKPYILFRRSQVEELNQYVPSLPTTTPVLLAGDFNTTPDGPEDRTIYQALTRHWQDLTAGARDECNLSRRRVGDAPLCGTHFETKGPLTREWIDYIVSLRKSQPVSVQRVEVITNAAWDFPFSDHEGLDITFWW